MENFQHQHFDDEGEEANVFGGFNTEEEDQEKEDGLEKEQDQVGEDEYEDEEDQQDTQDIKDDWDDIFVEGEEINADEKPHEGMKFETEHQAYTFYQRYAKREGFGVRKGGTRRSMKDKSIIGCRFYCNREGFRAEKYKQNMTSKKRKRGETRIGCEARLFVNKANDGTWVASLFIEEHNHKCVTPKKSHLFSSHRKIGENRAALIDKMKAAGIRTNLLMHYFSEEAQGMRNVGFTERDMRNHLRNKRQEVFQKGDAQCLLNYMNDKQVENPHFFYAIQLDSEGQMTNFFWVDAKSRMDYRHYGDVVCLDATYGTNAYSKPFVPIVGVNNHLQTVLFGCALMLDETESSFQWVLKTWIKAMSGAHPKVIFTDQDSAMTAAIANVFPNTRHRFCLWHIFQNAKKHLGSLFRRGSLFGKDFSNCVRNFEVIEDFEIGWNNLLTKYNLQENRWISTLYSKREKWVPVYSHDFFCADMSTTQRSESINKFFKGFLDRKMLLIDFVKGVDKALLRRREAEIDADFKMNNVQPTLMLHTPIEEMASKKYTPAMFLKFQEELIGSLRYTCEKVTENVGISTYRCNQVGQENNPRIVFYCSANQNVKCSCCKFEFAGILCRHILRMFITENIHHIPEQFILKRWSISANDAIVNDERGEQLLEDCHAPLTLRYSILCHEAIEVATSAVSSVEVARVARQGLLRTKREVEAAKQKEIQATKQRENNDTRKNCPTNDKGNMDKQTETINIKDPVLVKNKGRPGRYKAFWEKKAKKNHKETTSSSKRQQKTTSQQGTQYSNILQSNCGIPQVSNDGFSTNTGTDNNYTYYQNSSTGLDKQFYRNQPNSSTALDQQFYGHQPIFSTLQRLSTQVSSSSDFSLPFNYFSVDNDNNGT